MRCANYTIVADNEKELVIMDVGPWDQYPTITNSAEEVVEQLAGRLNGRRLMYYDSDNHLNQLLVKDERFAGFRHGGLS